MKNKNFKGWLPTLAGLLVAVLVAAILMAGLLLRDQGQDSAPGQYTMELVHSGIEGDASYTVTLYDPDGGAILRLEALHVAGTAENPGYAYQFTWLHGQPLTINESIQGVSQ